MTIRQSLPLDSRVAGSLTGGPSFSIRNRLVRAAWSPVWLLLAAWTPRHLRLWRVFLLRVFGARVAWSADVRGSARVWYPPHLIMHDHALIAARVNCYCMAPITVRQGALISQGAFLCAGTHDIDDPAFQLLAHPIDIGAHVWIAAEAFIGPGVTIGQGAVAGARAVVTRDIAPMAIAVGNPARVLKRQRKTVADKFDQNEG